MKLRPADLVCFAAVLLMSAAAALPLFASESGSHAAIQTDSGSIRIALDTDCEKTVVSNGHTLTVAVSNGEIRVANADCPDGLCKKSGSVRREGEAIVCLPARVMISIPGKAGVDGVAG